ncbi:MAG: siroheme decarboxylase subunit alpha [Desulfomicrobium sp.]|jgi:DNA-binding Lrp family transcriptional regulator|nr:siroheme decarboxylase subunit alpha [Desulfomicrobium sp.]NLV96796.1 Lrp/AsnC family transcriptional regulator [Desulfovibrionales bacterium]
MDDYDRKILDIIQTNFPLESRPYAQVGHQIGLTEAETLARVRALTEKGVIRRIGANFQTTKIGFHSTLCAASVPEEKIDLFVDLVNQLPGVTHNYLRAHHQNVWFTLIGPTKEHVRNTLAEITQKTGIGILNLPTIKMFKIKVDFKMDDQEED